MGSYFPLGSISASIPSRMPKSVDPNCRAFQRAIDVLGRPWNGLILGLLQDGPLRFSELEESARGLGPKTLSARLRVLETGAIIARQVEAGPPVRVRYSLTAKGRAFGRVAEAIHRWGSELTADEPAPRSSRQPAGPPKRKQRA
jgi:DNA-binding HxlR family transcriptional regulator